MRKYQQEYHKNNPHKSRENRRRRRATELNNPSSKYTETQVLEMYGTDCYICGIEIDLDAPRQVGRKKGWEMGLHIDHVIPMVDGGPDTLENVRPSHAKCNLQKGFKPVQLVVQEKGQ